MFKSIANWVQQNLQINSDTQTKLLITLAIILVLLFLRPLVIAIVGRRTDDNSVIYRWRKGTEYLSLILGVLLIGRIWLASTQSLITYLGLLSAGLAIALQDPITNLVGWLFIIWRRPFEVGDRIEIGERAGDVIDVRFFQFTLMEIRNWVNADQSTGRVLHLPNKLVFSEGVANYSKGFAYIWHEIPVEVTFESNWRRAKEIVQSIGERHAAHLSESAHKRVREAARRYMINYEKLTPIVYTSVNPSGVLLTLRYLSDPRQRRTSEQAIWEDILDAFANESEIGFAYPTQRFYYELGKDRSSIPDIFVGSDLQSEHKTSAHEVE